MIKQEDNLFKKLLIEVPLKTHIKISIEMWYKCTFYDFKKKLKEKLWKTRGKK